MISPIYDLNELADAIHENAKAKGFHPEEPIHVFIANQCNNLHAEVTELWDAYRSGAENLNCDKPIQLTCAEEELADIIIRALDVSKRLGINIVEAIHIKHNYNTTRPYKHGKKN